MNSDDILSFAVILTVIEDFLPCLRGPYWKEGRKNLRRLRNNWVPALADRHEQLTDAIQQLEASLTDEDEDSDRWKKSRDLLDRLHATRDGLDHQLTDLFESIVQMKAAVTAHAVDPGASAVPSSDTLTQMVEETERNARVLNATLREVNALSVT